MYCVCNGSHLQLQEFGNITAVRKLKQSKKADGDETAHSGFLLY
jgi:hypothetical protein